MQKNEDTVHVESILCLKQRAYDKNLWEWFSSLISTLILMEFDRRCTLLCLGITALASGH